MYSPSIFSSIRFRLVGVLGSVLLLTAYPLAAMVSPRPAGVKVANPLSPASPMPKLSASALAQSDKPHTLAASIYRIGQNLKTTLMLNNKGPHPLEVRPTLYSLSGERLEISPVTLEANSYSVINMSDLASPGGEAFREGSLQVFYRGNDLLLGAQVKMDGRSSEPCV